MMKRATLVAACIAMIVQGASIVEAQQKGQSAKISHGVVVGVEKVKLKNNDALKGALLGGTIAYASTSGGSSSKKRRNTALGATAGGLLGASPAEEGMLYTVNTGSSTIQVVTDQTEIRLDDCVVVEETSRGTNIRRMSDDVCSPQSQDVVDALEPEFQEEAAECAAAKAELGAAKTDAEFERAMTKVSILCDD
jgi:outer membrane lipoprotein SlyB